jgi:hypothetical protein
MVPASPSGVVARRWQSGDRFPVGVGTPHRWVSGVGRGVSSDSGAQGPKGVYPLTKKNLVTSKAEAPGQGNCDSAKGLRP